MILTSWVFSGGPGVEERHPKGRFCCHALLRVYCEKTLHDLADTRVDITLEDLLHTTRKVTRNRFVTVLKIHSASEGWTGTVKCPAEH